MRLSTIGFLLLCHYVICNSAYSLPLLFMDSADLVQPWGKILPQGSALKQVNTLQPPPENYTAGATIFAAFEITATPSSSAREYEIFVAVGRPGEPILGEDSPASAIEGVEIKRYTTQDFSRWSEGVTVLDLPNGWKPDALPGENDGSIWTAKSMDRDPASGVYLMFAAYGSAAYAFTATRPSQPGDFKPLTTPSNAVARRRKGPGGTEKGMFHDHDDTNVIFWNNSWVDMQIMYENLTTTGVDYNKGRKKYCDNIGTELRRVVTVRTSSDGSVWSQDAGCLDTPQTSEHCKAFDTSQMITADREDPPELEFYRIRPFYVGTGAARRLMAHVLDYAPSPQEVVYSEGYGRQPLWYCKDRCCHGPHMFEELWVGPASGDPTDMAGWRRPYRDTRFAPHDIWLMAQPLDFNQSHIWVDNGRVWSVPQHRLGGVYAPANGEFSTQTFSMPGDGPLWIDAQAKWEGGNHVGVPEGADEGQQAYAMVELSDASTGKVIAPRQDSILTNFDSPRALLKWQNKTSLELGIATGTQVQARIFFRAATIFAIGSD